MSGQERSELQQEQAGSADYQGRLGLKAPPFSAGAPGECFFEHAALVQRLNLLAHLTGYSHLLLVVTGKAGSGKTTLLDQLIARAEPTWQICRSQADAMMDADELLRRIGACFELPSVAGRDAMLQDLKQRLIRLREGGQLAVLLIDDAHELSDQAVEALVLLAGDSDEHGTFVHVVLFGEPQIRAVLNSPTVKPLTERLIHTLDIPVLSEEQIDAYVMHRLRAAGYQGPIPFTPAQIKDIYRSAQGLPGAINHAAHLMLMAGGQRVEVSSTKTATAKAAAVEGQRFMTGKKHPLRWVAIGTGAVFLVAVLLLQDSINVLFTGKEGGEPQEAVVERDTVPLQLPMPSMSTGSETQATEPLAPPAPAAEAVPPTAELVQAPEPVETESAVIERAAEEEISLAQESEGRLPGVAEPVEPQPAAEHRAVEPVSTAPAVATEEEKKPASGTSQKEPTAAPPVVEEAAPPATQATQAKPTASQPVAKRESWLLAQTPSHYTLQLLGASEEQAILQFIERHKLAGQVAYFHTYHKGKDWYALLYGDFPNREAALAAMSKLPAAVQKQGIWPRSFASVHADIAKVRERATAQ